METKILVQKNSIGNIKFIEFILDKATISRKWGIINGKIQTTSNTYDYINKGKSNELSPQEAAKENYKRIINAKIKEGYLVVESLNKLPNLDSSTINFKNLPVQFCCSKPYTSISSKKLNDLINQNRVRFFQKENGLCHFILITDDNEVKIYSRRIDEHTAKYPNIVKAVKALNLPTKTLLAAEFIVGSTDNCVGHMDRFKRVQSISRSDTLKGKVKSNITKTLVLQEETPVIAIIFNILYLNGVDKTFMPYDSIVDTMVDIESYDTSGYIKTPRELDFLSYQEAYDWVKHNKYTVEGLVIWMKDDNAKITYNGKPSRRACYKLKATQEDDVIAYGYNEGTGAKQGKIGSLLIGKYDKTGTKIIPMGSVGSGLRIKLGECDIEYWHFPCVIEIAYEQRFTTGKYQFPRFIRKHGDKIPSEVTVNNKLL